jgi:hypothetical protein
MNIAICIGGTGVRCFESFLYSVFAGKITDENFRKLRVLVIDKDKNSGALRRCHEAIGEYQSMCKVLDSKGKILILPEIQLVEDWDIQGNLPPERSLRQIFGGVVIHC